MHSASRERARISRWPAQTIGVRAIGTQPNALNEQARRQWQQLVALGGALPKLAPEELALIGEKRRTDYLISREKRGADGLCSVYARAQRDKLHRAARRRDAAVRGLREPPAPSASRGLQGSVGFDG
jgi:hypothetical protein